MRWVLIAATTLLSTTVADSIDTRATQTYATTAAVVEFLDASGATIAVGAPVVLRRPPRVVTDGSLVDLEFPPITIDPIPKLPAVHEVRLTYDGTARVRAAPGLWLVIEEGGRESRAHTVLPLRAQRIDPDALGRFRRLVPLGADESTITNEVRRAVNMSRQTAIGRVFLAVPLLFVGTGQVTAMITEVEF